MHYTRLREIMAATGGVACLRTVAFFGRADARWAGEEQWLRGTQLTLPGEAHPDSM